MHQQDGAGADGQQADAAPELDADAGPSQPAADASGSDGYGSDSEGEGPDDGVPAAIVLDTATAVGLFDLARQLEDQQQAGVRPSAGSSSRLKCACSLASLSL